jgi:hypothetical protein
MIEIPSEVLRRRDDYCADRSLQIKDIMGFGVDAFVWQLVDDNILKVFRNEYKYQRERDVYHRLRQKSLYRIQGFAIPLLEDFDDETFVLEISFVTPPYILDFAACTLDTPPAGFDPDDAEWTGEQSRKFGRDWPDIRRLLDALRQYGIYYTDVHTQNIRVRA